MERHAHELPRESTFFLCLDTIGSPNLLVLRGGMLKLREYLPHALELLDSTAEELGIELVPNLRLRTTDGIFPLAAGYRCASVASCNQWKNPSNYHWPTDTPENIHYDTLADAIRLSEVIRKLDAGSETCLVTPRSALRTSPAASPPLPRGPSAARS